MRTRPGQASAFQSWSHFAAAFLDATRGGVGALNLGGTKLVLSTGFDPAPGTEFMIVRNVSGQPVAGTFAGLPQNGYVSTPGAKPAIMAPTPVISAFWPKPVSS